MTFFSDGASQALKAQNVFATIGAAFNFETGVEYYLRSTEPRIDPNGVKWQAASTLVNIDGLQFGIGRRTQPVTMTMNGLPGSEWVRLALTQATIVRGRKIEFYLHLFNSDWSYVEAPTSLGVYVMDMLTPAFDGGQQVAAVKLTCEPIGVSRFRAPNSYLSYEDQQARHPGDEALFLMAKYVVNQTLPPW